MALRRETVAGLEQVLQLLKRLQEESVSIYVLFCGERNAETGESWCPDCVKAEPVVEKVLSEQTGGGVYVHCSVGGRDAWKDPQNPFRLHPELKLTGVPTLLKWRTAKRLEPEQCAKEEMVRLLFGEGD